ncbi:hypothetical protein CYLTODRAFT_441331 [Cylindrobasidium torrendii FP15055 ss-10]|uniref:Carbohydrate-binding module family 50 protein n=1 Tax=Cylindrobasidium torrendii FP15055 ss-10 TaxID=1314674 RepID=A0A0D7BP64_9AGAR|nr:hypothetical protein CYLTODRAFT_441331 [Cylindrobasidium torrendii FP15055 ss-10]
MGRWTQYDEVDGFRLDGLERTAYDADTQTYIYTDPRNGQIYLGVPGSQFAVARKKSNDPAPDRPHAFADSRHPQLSPVGPSSFHDFLPAHTIASPSTLSSATAAPETRTTRWAEACRRTALPRLQSVLGGSKRSASQSIVSVPSNYHDDKSRSATVSSSHSSYPDEKRRTQSVSNANMPPSTNTFLIPRKPVPTRRPGSTIPDDTLGGKSEDRASKEDLSRR